MSNQMTDFITLGLFILAVASICCWWFEANEIDAPGLLKIAAWPSIIVIGLYVINCGWQNLVVPEFDRSIIPSPMVVVAIVAGFVMTIRDKVFAVVDGLKIGGM